MQSTDTSTKITQAGSNESLKAPVIKIVISFEGLGLPPGLNQTKGHHWGKTTGERKKWRMLARTLAEEVNLRVSPDCRALVHWDVYLGDWRPRDEDNLRGAMKPVQDGLVDAGVIRGDSVWDIRTSYSFYPTGDKGFIITIYELPELDNKPVKKPRHKVV